MSGRTSIVIVILFALAGGSCVSSRLGQNLDSHYGSRVEEFDDLMASHDDEPDPKQLDWNEALARMQQDNLGLARSTQLLEDSEKATRRQWKTLVPRVATFINLSKGMLSFSDITTNDLNKTVALGFNIPNPFNFYGNLYATALQGYNARLSHELDQRRAYIELYTAFLTAAELREAAQDLDLRHKGLLVIGVDGSDGLDDVYRTQRDWRNLKWRIKHHRVQVNRLLNTPGANWNLVGKLPHVSFRKKFRNIRLGDDFGKLALEMYAIQIESAIIARQRIKFQQWPTISFGVSQPPLYSDATSDGIEFEDFRLFAGATKSIDLTDPLGMEQIQNAEIRLVFTRQQMLQRMEREAVQMLGMRETYTQLLAEERRVMRAIQMREPSSATDSEVVLVELEALYEHKKRLRDLQKQIHRLDLQFLIWHENFWKS